MNAKEAVKAANQAREAYLDSLHPLKQALAERCHLERLYNGAHKHWHADESEENSNALRKAYAALEAASRRVWDLNASQKPAKARMVWLVKLGEATRLLMAEAGLHDAQSCDKEGAHAGL